MSLSATHASSIYAGDYRKWGPSNSLTPVSEENYGYWHSAPNDLDPYITLKLEKESEVVYVEVTDRKDCCAERFVNVEVVLIGNDEQKMSCGVKSYQGQNELTYR